MTSGLLAGLRAEWADFRAGLRAEWRIFRQPPASPAPALDAALARQSAATDRLAALCARLGLDTDRSNP